MMTTTMTTTAAAVVAHCQIEFEIEFQILNQFGNNMIAKTALEIDIMMGLHLQKGLRVIDCDDKYNI